jgi:hypothetical protein
VHFTAPLLYLYEFPTGPAVGDRLPEFKLPNQDGDMIDFHADRGDCKAIVVFYRSAVCLWSRSGIEVQIFPMNEMKRLFDIQWEIPRLDRRISQ